MQKKLAILKTAVYEELVNQVRDNLTPDLLKPQFRDAPFPMGHCYVASEAIYHLAGGKKSGLKPMRLRMPDGVVHWWLEAPDGEVIDPTHDQFDHAVPYAEGKSGGFLTREPSARARELMSRIEGRQAKSANIIDIHGLKPHAHDELTRRTFIYIIPTDHLYLSENNAYHNDMFDWIYNNAPDDAQYLESRNFALGFVERNYEDHALEVKNYWAEGGRVPDQAMQELEQYFGERIYQTDFDYPRDWRTIDDAYDDWGGDTTQQWPTNADEGSEPYDPLHGYEHQRQSNIWKLAFDNNFIYTARGQLYIENRPHPQIMREHNIFRTTKFVPGILMERGDKLYITFFSWSQDDDAELHDRARQAIEYATGKFPTEVSYEEMNNLDVQHQGAMYDDNTRMNQRWDEHYDSLPFVWFKGQVWLGKMPSDHASLLRQNPDLHAAIKEVHDAPWTDSNDPEYWFGRVFRDGEVVDWQDRPVPDRVANDVKAQMTDEHWNYDEDEGRYSATIKQIKFQPTEWGGSREGYAQPVVYDQTNDVVYIGPNGASHSETLRNVQEHRDLVEHPVDEYGNEIEQMPPGYGYSDDPRYDQLGFGEIFVSPFTHRMDWDWYSGPEPQETIQQYVDKFNQDAPPVVPPLSFESGTQPIEVMYSNPHEYEDYQYWLNGGYHNDPDRARLAWVWHDGTLFIGQNHKSIMRGMQQEGLDARTNSAFGWIDPTEDGTPWSFVTDYGTQDAQAQQEASLFFNTYGPNRVMDYARNGTPLHKASGGTWEYPPGDYVYSFIYQNGHLYIEGGGHYQIMRNHLNEIDPNAPLAAGWIFKDGQHFYIAFYSGALLGHGNAEQEREAWKLLQKQYPDATIWSNQFNDEAMNDPNERQDLGWIDERFALPPLPTPHDISPVAGYGMDGLYYFTPKAWIYDPQTKEILNGDYHRNIMRKNPDLFNDREWNDVVYGWYDNDNQRAMAAPESYGHPREDEAVEAAQHEMLSNPIFYEDETTSHKIADFEYYTGDAWVYDPLSKKLYTGPYHQWIMQANPELFERYRRTGPNDHPMKDFMNPEIERFATPLVLGISNKVYSDFGESSATPEQEAEAIQAYWANKQRQSGWKLAAIQDHTQEWDLPAATPGDWIGFKYIYDPQDDTLHAWQIDEPDGHPWHREALKKLFPFESSQFLYETYVCGWSENNTYSVYKFQQSDEAIARAEQLIKEYIESLGYKDVKPYLGKVAYDGYYPDWGSAWIYDPSTKKLYVGSYHGEIIAENPELTYKMRGGYDHMHPQDVVPFSVPYVLGWIRDGEPEVDSDFGEMENISPNDVNDAIHAVFQYLENRHSSSVRPVRTSTADMRNKNVIVEPFNPWDGYIFAYDPANSTIYTGPTNMWHRKLLDAIGKFRWDATWIYGWNHMNSDGLQVHNIREEQLETIEQLLKDNPWIYYNSKLAALKLQPITENLGNDMGRARYGYPVIFIGNTAFIGPLGSHHADIVRYLAAHNYSIDFYSADDMANIWPPHTLGDNEDWVAEPYGTHLDPEDKVQLEDWARQQAGNKTAELTQEVEPRYNLPWDNDTWQGGWIYDPKDDKLYTGRFHAGIMRENPQLFYRDDVVFGHFANNGDPIHGSFEQNSNPFQEDIDRGISLAKQWWFEHAPKYKQTAYGGEGFIFIYDTETGQLAVGPDWDLHKDLFRQEFGSHIQMNEYPERYVFGYNGHHGLFFYNWPDEDKKHEVEQALDQYFHTSKTATTFVAADPGSIEYANRWIYMVKDRTITSAEVPSMTIPYDWNWFTSWIYVPALDKLMISPKPRVNHGQLMRANPELASEIWNEKLPIIPGLIVQQNYYDPYDQPVKPKLGILPVYSDEFAIRQMMGEDSDIERAVKAVQAWADANTDWGELEIVHDDEEQNYSTEGKIAMPWSGEGNVPRYLYHVSPTAARASIQTHGLDWSQRAEDLWSEKGFDFGSEEYPAGNYLFVDEKRAWEYPDAHIGKQFDLWRVDTEGLYLEGDPQFPTDEDDIPEDIDPEDTPDYMAYYTTDPIPFNRLTLMDTVTGQGWDQYASVRTLTHQNLSHPSDHLSGQVMRRWIVVNGELYINEGQDSSHADMYKRLFRASDAQEQLQAGGMIEPSGVISIYYNTTGIRAPQLRRWVADSLNRTPLTPIGQHPHQTCPPRVPPWMEQEHLLPTESTFRVEDTVTVQAHSPDALHGEAHSPNRLAVSNALNVVNLTGWDNVVGRARAVAFASDGTNLYFGISHPQIVDEVMKQENIPGVPTQMHPMFNDANWVFGWADRIGPDDPWDAQIQSGNFWHQNKVNQGFDERIRRAVLQYLNTGQIESHISSSDDYTIVGEGRDYGHNAVIYDELNQHMYIAPGGHHYDILREFPYLVGARTLWFEVDPAGKLQQYDFGERASIDPEIQEIYDEWRNTQRTSAVNYDPNNDSWFQSWFYFPENGGLFVNPERYGNHRELIQQLGLSKEDILNRKLVPGQFWFRISNGKKAVELDIYSDYLRNEDLEWVRPDYFANLTQLAVKSATEWIKENYPEFKLISLATMDTLHSPESHLSATPKVVHIPGDEDDDFADMEWRIPLVYDWSDNTVYFGDYDALHRTLLKAIAGEEDGGAMRVDKNRFSTGYFVGEGVEGFTPGVHWFAFYDMKTPPPDVTQAVNNTLKESHISAVPPPAIIQPSPVVKNPAGVNFPTMKPTPVRGEEPVPNPAGYSYDYPEQQIGVTAANLSLTAAQVASGHVAVWLGAFHSSKSWIQGGIGHTAGQDQPYVYVEIGHQNGQQQYMPIAPYTPGTPIHFQLVNRNGIWSVKVGNKLYGQVYLGNNLETRAIAEDLYDQQPNEFQWHIQPTQQKHAEQLELNFDPDIGPKVVHIPTRGGFSKWRIPVMYDANSNTVYYGDEGGLHADLLRWILGHSDFAHGDVAVENDPDRWAAGWTTLGGPRDPGENKWFGGGIEPGPEVMEAVKNALGIQESHKEAVTWEQFNNRDNTTAADWPDYVGLIYDASTDHLYTSTELDCAPYHPNMIKASPELQRIVKTDWRSLYFGTASKKEDGWVWGWGTLEQHQGDPKFHNRADELTQEYFGQKTSASEWQVIKLPYPNDDIDLERAVSSERVSTFVEEHVRNMLVQSEAEEDPDDFPGYGNWYGSFFYDPKTDKVYFSRGGHGQVIEDNGHGLPWDRMIAGWLLVPEGVDTWTDPSYDGPFIVNTWGGDEPGENYDSFPEGTKERIKDALRRDGWKIAKAKVATEIKFVPNSMNDAKLNTDRVPFVWDSKTDTLYYAEAGGLHPWIYKHLLGNPLHATQIHRQKDLDQQFASGVINPNEDDDFLSGVQWFYGPDPTPEAQRAAEELKEKLYGFNYT